MVKVNLPFETKNFTIPASVVENYLPECDEAKLKTLLLILYHPSLTVKKLAEQIGITVSEVEICLKFWEKRNILKVGKEKQKLNKTEPLDSKLTMKEITQIIESSPELKFVIKLLPSIINRIPNQFDMLNIVNFNLNLGMQPELILQLIKYCITVGKNSAYSIKKEGNFWFESGISSLEEAEEFIKQAQKLNNLHMFVKNELQLKVIGNIQKLTIERWINEFRFKQDIIKKACEIAKSQKDTSNVAYVNGILSNWYKKGIKTLEDLEIKKTASRFKKNRYILKSEPEFSSFTLEDIDKF